MLNTIKGFIIGLVSVLAVAVILIFCFVKFTDSPTLRTVGPNYNTINTGIESTVGFQGFPKLKSNTSVYFLDYYYSAPLYRLSSEYNNVSTRDKQLIYNKIKAIRGQLRILDSTIPSVASDSYFMDICSETDGILNSIEADSKVNSDYLTKLRDTLQRVELLNTVNTDKFGDSFITNFNTQNHILIKS